MQEIFEKIIEKLEEELKLANKDKERCAKENHLQFYSAKCYANGIANAIEIVKKAAEECKHGHFGCNTNGQHEKCSTCCDYDCKNRNREWFGLKDDNNGWIPCSEQLPEEAFGCLVTVMDCNPSTQTEFENILPYFVGYDGETWNDADGEEIPFEVIAWRKLPTPYQPKGE